MREAIIVIAIGAIAAMVGNYLGNQNKQIENLNKQLKELECYRDNYLIMADSISNIHRSCFKIGK